MLNPVAARSLASAFGRSFAGISGSNSVGDMDVYFWSMSFSVRLRFLRQGDPPFRGVLSNVVCLYEISKPQQRGCCTMGGGGYKCDKFTSTLL